MGSAEKNSFQEKNNSNKVLAHVIAPEMNPKQLIAIDFDLFSLVVESASYRRSVLFTVFGGSNLIEYPLFKP